MYAHAGRRTENIEEIIASVFENVIGPVRRFEENDNEC